MIKYRVEDGLKISGLTMNWINYYHGRCTYNTQSYVDLNDVPSLLELARYEDGELVIPRGLEDEFLDLCKQQGLQVSEEPYSAGRPHTYTIAPDLNYESGVFRYQGDAIRELLKHKTGRLQAPTGSGKTVMSCLAIAMLEKQPVLFLADQDHLLKQFQQTVTEVLGIPQKEIGIIKGPKRKVKPVTCGSLRTLGKEDFNLHDYKNVFSTVFFDECHLSTALTFRRVLLGLAPERLYGLSATPEHYSSEDLNHLMEAMLGPIKVTISEDQIPKRLKPLTFTRKTGSHYYFNDGPDIPQWRRWQLKHKLDTELTEDDSRNNLIAQDCKRLVQEANHKVIICINRVKHGLFLKNKLEAEGLTCSFPYKLKEDEKGKDKSTVDHKQLGKDISAVLSGDIDVIIGTYKLFGTGFDCKPLSVVLMAAPFSGKNTTQIEQVIGRVLRYMPDKDQAIAIDYADTSGPNQRLTEWHEARADFMKERWNQHLILEYGEK